MEYNFSFDENKSLVPMPGAEGPLLQGEKDVDTLCFGIKNPYRGVNLTPWAFTLYAEGTDSTRAIAVDREEVLNGFLLKVPVGIALSTLGRRVTLSLEARYGDRILRSRKTTVDFGAGVNTTQLNEYAESVFDSLMTKVSDALSQAQISVTSASSSATSAKTSADTAKTHADSSQKYSWDARDYAKEAGDSQSWAEGYKNAAQVYAEAAGLRADDARTAADDAEKTSSGVKDLVTAAEGHSNTAQQAARQAQETADGIGASVASQVTAAQGHATSASEAADRAQTSAVNAQNSAGDAAGAAQDAREAAERANEDFRISGSVGLPANLIQNAGFLKGAEGYASISIAAPDVPVWYGEHYAHVNSAYPLVTGYNLSLKAGTKYLVSVVMVGMGTVVFKVGEEQYSFFHMIANVNTRKNWLLTPSEDITAPFRIETTANAMYVNCILVFAVPERYEHLTDAEWTALIAQDYPPCWQDAQPAAVAWSRRAAALGENLTGLVKASKGVTIAAQPGTDYADCDSGDMALTGPGLTAQSGVWRRSGGVLTAVGELTLVSGGSGDISLTNLPIAPAHLAAGTVTKLTPAISGYSGFALAGSNEGAVLTGVKNGAVQPVDAGEITVPTTIQYTLGYPV